MRLAFSVAMEFHLETGVREPLKHALNLQMSGLKQSPEEPSRSKSLRSNESRYVYIMASGRNGTLYIGVTSDLAKRAWEHRCNGVVAASRRKYRCKLLVWYEAREDLQQARLRELQMKKWKRLWKLSAIEQMNPDWRRHCTPTLL